MSKLCAFVAAFTVSLCAVAAHADSLIGSTVDVQYLFPTTGSVYQDFGTQTVSSGLTDGVGGFVNLTFSADQIAITTLNNLPYALASFNGFDVTFLTGPTITDVSEDPSSSSLFALGSVLASTGDTISLNLSGTCSACSGGETIVLDLNTPMTSVTPEPSSLVLFGTGLLSLAGFMRRRLA